MHRRFAVVIILVASFLVFFLSASAFSVKQSADPNAFVVGVQDSVGNWGFSSFMPKEKTRTGIKYGVPTRSAAEAGLFELSTGERIYFVAKTSLQSQNNLFSVCIIAKDYSFSRYVSFVIDCLGEMDYYSEPKAGSKVILEWMRMPSPISVKSGEPLIIKSGSAPPISGTIEANKIFARPFPFSNPILTVSFKADTVNDKLIIDKIEFVEGGEKRLAVILNQLPQDRAPASTTVSAAESQENFNELRDSIDGLITGCTSPLSDACKNIPSRLEEATHGFREGVEELSSSLLEPIAEQPQEIAAGAARALTASAMQQMLDSFDDLGSQLKEKCAADIAMNIEAGKERIRESFDGFYSNVSGLCSMPKGAADSLVSTLAASASQQALASLDDIKSACSAAGGTVRNDVSDAIASAKQGISSTTDSLREQLGRVCTTPSRIACDIANETQYNAYIGTQTRLGEMKEYMTTSLTGLRDSCTAGALSACSSAGDSAQQLGREALSGVQSSLEQILDLGGACSGYSNSRFARIFYRNVSREIPKGSAFVFENPEAFKLEISGVNPTKGLYLFANDAEQKLDCQQIADYYNNQNAAPPAATSVVDYAFEGLELKITKTTSLAGSSMVASGMNELPLLQGISTAQFFFVSSADLKNKLTRDLKAFWAINKINGKSPEEIATREGKELEFKVCQLTTT